MHKIVVGVFNPGESPADNGRMIPILGEDKEHVDIAQYVVDGYQVINH